MQCTAIAAAAWRLDTHRTRVLAAYPRLSYTEIYNVLEAERDAAAGEGAPLTEKQQKTHRDAGLTLLAQIHADLDQAVADAYGWPVGLSPSEITRRLSLLNIERQAEEAAGHVRYLRPAFQAPGETTQATLDVTVPDAVATWPSPSRGQPRRRPARSPSGASCARHLPARRRGRRPPVPER